MLSDSLIVAETTRHGLLSYLEGDSFLSSSLTTTAIAEHINSYWSGCHPTFPILHRPSFIVASAPLPLLCAMTVCGAQVSTKMEDQALAVGLNPKLRALLHSVSFLLSSEGGLIEFD